MVDKGTHEPLERSQEAMMFSTIKFLPHMFCKACEEEKQELDDGMMG